MRDRIINILGVPRFREMGERRAPPRFGNMILPPPPRIPEEVMRNAIGDIGKVVKPVTPSEMKKIETDIKAGIVKPFQNVYQGAFRLWPSSWAMEIGLVRTDKGGGTYKIPFKTAFSSLPYFVRTSWGYLTIDLAAIKFRIPLFTFITDITNEHFKITYFFGKERTTSYIAIGPL